MDLQFPPGIKTRQDTIEVQGQGITRFFFRREDNGIGPDVAFDETPIPTLKVRFDPYFLNTLRDSPG